MKVSELMTHEVLYCREELSANAAARVMWENNCGSVPIVGDDLKLTGILTDRDICMAAYTQGLPLGLIGVASAMAREPICVHGDDDIAVAHRLMRAHRIRRLLVVDGQGKLSGMLALADLARAAQGREALEAEVGKTLAAISEAGTGKAIDAEHPAEAAPASNSTPMASHDEGLQAEGREALSAAPAAARVVEQTKPSQPETSAGTGAVAEAPSLGRFTSSQPPTPSKPESPTPRPPSRRRGPRQR